MPPCPPPVPASLTPIYSDYVIHTFILTRVNMIVEFSLCLVFPGYCFCLEKHQISLNFLTLYKKCTKRL